jgi:hypothetical protein
MKKFLVTILFLVSLSFATNLYTGTTLPTKSYESGTNNLDTSFAGSTLILSDNFWGKAIWGTQNWPKTFANMDLNDAGTANYDTFYQVIKECQKLFGEDSLYGVGQKYIYINRNFNWVKICTVTTAMNLVHLTDDYFKAKNGDLYFIYDNDSLLYKVSKNGGQPTAIVTTPKVIGFSFDNNNKIWFTTSNSLYKCDLDGNNKVLIKSNSIYSTIRTFVINTNDTSIIYRNPTSFYSIFHDKKSTSSDLCNLIPASIQDSIIWIKLDQNNDVWFSRTNKMTNYNELYKYDLDDTNSVTSYVARMPKARFVMNMKESNEYAYEAKGDTTYRHQLNHKPRLLKNIINDSVFYYDQTNKRIQYSCSLKVTDDNATQTPTYIG